MRRTSIFTQHPNPRHGRHVSKQFTLIVISKINTKLTKDSDDKSLVFALHTPSVRKDKLGDMSDLDVDTMLSPSLNTIVGIQTSDDSVGHARAWLTIRARVGRNLYVCNNPKERKLTTWWEGKQTKAKGNR